MTTPLQQAAQAMIDRWEHPEFIGPFLAERMLTLRKALDAELQQSVEPAAWMTGDGRVSMAETVNTAMPKAAKDSFCIPLYLHPPQPQLRECWYESDELKVCRKCGQLHDKAITPPQQAKPTGWDNGLSQDYCKELGQWLASRPGARQQVKEMFETDAQQAKQVPMTTAQIEDEWYSTSSDPAFNDFVNGVRLAEKHHRIGGQP